MILTIVDTNVAVTANEPVGASPKCVLACIDALSAIVAGNAALVLDHGGHILDEYLGQRPFGYPQGPGDQFIVEAITHQANPDRCTRVSITPHPERGYEEFPANTELRAFDWDDRKFVATAISHCGRPPILNAVDSDYRNFAEHLAKHVDVTELCPG